MTQIKRRQDRWFATRSALLDAAVKTLVEDGYGATTLQKVQARAGVSRGSLTHHFASKQELLVAAVHHVADAQGRELARLLDGRRGEPTLEHVVHSLATFMSGSVFAAGIELWMAARTDDALRAELVPVERELGRELREILIEAPGVQDALGLEREDLDMLLVLLRGAAITGILREDDAALERLLARWIEQVTRS